jgi:cyclic pyranopterin monophosphate synthase
MKRRRLSLVRSDGSIKMVDVGAKALTSRVAVAEGEVTLSPGTLRMVRARTAKKGDVLVTAQIAGILAAKRTAQLIPLCHSLPLTNVEVTCMPMGENHILVRCRAACNAQTGVEMEALVGAAVAALTIYDMCKSVDKSIIIERLQLIEKSGGKSGHFRRKLRAR